MRPKVANLSFVCALAHHVGTLKHGNHVLCCARERGYFVLEIGIPVLVSESNGCGHDVEQLFASVGAKVRWFGWDRAVEGECRDTMHVEDDGDGEFGALAREEVKHHLRKTAHLHSKWEGTFNGWQRVLCVL